MGPGCIGKSNTNNLPGPTDVTKNPNGKKTLFFKDATQKSASVVVEGIAVELQPRRPIFEKCSHLREKGGVLTLRTPVGFALTPTVWWYLGYFVPFSYRFEVLGGDTNSSLWLIPVIWSIGRRSTSLLW